MKQFCISLLLVIIYGCDSPLTSKKDSFVTRYEKSNGKETPSYQEVIDFYKELSQSYTTVALQTMGLTDSGYPLHIVTYNPDGDFNFNNIRKDKRIILINNGIHPGEPDGIDATMLLIRNLAQKQLEAPKNTVIVAIPVYNIGGALNRNSTTRVNQDGPQEYGFRGNARNYDLNRDFIKSDTKNAQSFAEIFHLVQPDVLIDNHVSNGADYQYVLTHLFTQHNKLGGELGEYLHTKMVPDLEKSLAAKTMSKEHDSLPDRNWIITPYVNVWNKPPDHGFSQFMDYPRYSVGYSALWNVLGITVETHMLKPYKERVEGTYELMKSMIDLVDKDAETISQTRKKNEEYFAQLSQYPVDWELDTTRFSTFEFKGYKADTITSEVTGLPRLKYDRNQPFSKEIVYQNYFKPTKMVNVPKGYIIPQGWHKIIELLQKNKITMNQVDQDKKIWAEYYRIETFQTRTTPFEGHYQHYNTTVTKHQDSISVRKGDYLIDIQQPGLRYLLEVLEPEAPDSFFNWNFFDTILQQKEGFSAYVFEDIAKEI